MSGFEPAKRVQRYLDMRREYPMTQLGDGLHCINMGSEWEAELLLSDLYKLKSAYDAMLEALRFADDDIEVCGSTAQVIREAISKAEGR